MLANDVMQAMPWEYETRGVCTLDHRLRGWSEREGWGEGCLPGVTFPLLLMKNVLELTTAMVLNTVNSLTLNSILKIN